MKIFSFWSWRIMYLWSFKPKKIFMRKMFSNRFKELIYANFNIVEEEKVNLIVKDSLFKFDFSFKWDWKEIFIKCLIFDSNLEFLTIEKINLLNKESSKEKPINIPIPRVKFDEWKVLFKCKELTIEEDNKCTIKDICIVTKINRQNYIKKFPWTWEVVLWLLWDCIAYKQKGKLLFCSWNEFEIVDIPEENIFSFISTYKIKRLHRVALWDLSKANQNKWERELLFWEPTEMENEYFRWRKTGYKKPIKSILVKNSTYYAKQYHIPDGLSRFFYNFRCLLYNRVFEKNIGKITFLPFRTKCTNLPISFSGWNNKYILSNRDSSDVEISDFWWELYNGFWKLIFWID